MKAIILNLCAWIMLPFMDAIAKYLSSELSFFVTKYKIAINNAEIIPKNKISMLQE